MKPFLAEVRTIPRYVAALAVDPRRIDEFEKIGRALLAVDRLANDDPAIIDIFDKIQDVIGRTGLSLKERLLEVGKLLMQVRDDTIKFG